MNNTLLRPAVASEWQAIQALNNEVFISDGAFDPDMDLNWPYTEKAKKYYQSLANGTHGHCLVAEKGGKIVGYIALVKKDFGWRKSTYIEVDNMGVTKDERSSGIGTILMDGAAEWANSQGATRLFVAAFWANLRGIKFYKKNGFYEIGIELERKLSDVT